MASPSPSTPLALPPPCPFSPPSDPYPGSGVSTGCPSPSAAAVAQEKRGKSSFYCFILGRCLSPSVRHGCVVDLLLGGRRHTGPSLGRGGGRPKTGGEESSE
eukprot:Hpha_TRINITY_DN14752_c0_g1::TRINITY_DN14752_c0_g1_i1::g.102404::m.102404